MTFMSELMNHHTASHQVEDVWSILEIPGDLKNTLWKYGRP